MAEPKLHWSEELGYGYLPPVGEFEYDDGYFEEYERRAATETGRLLTEKRLNLVDRYTSRDELVVDVGIGCGQFVEARGGPTMGYDVMPKAVEWLRRRDRWVDARQVANLDNATFWDSLEHIADPAYIVSRVRRCVFVSIPLFEGKQDAEASKHFKPGEHLWYFTYGGLLRWFLGLGFRLLSSNRMEEALGREGIGSFAFQRVEWQ